MKTGNGRKKTSSTVAYETLIHRLLVAGIASSIATGEIYKAVNVIEKRPEHGIDDSQIDQQLIRAWKAVCVTKDRLEGASQWFGRAGHGYFAAPRKFDKQDSEDRVTTANRSAITRGSHHAR